MPDKWFSSQHIDTEVLGNELASYLQAVEFKDSEFFYQDLEDKNNEFKAFNNIKKPIIEIANKYQSLHIGINNYQQVKSNLFKEVYKSHEEVKKY